MGISRLLFAVGLAFCAILAPMPSAVVVAQERVETTDAEFKEQIKRLEQTSNVTVRLEALKWLNRHYRAKNAHLAMATLEQCIRKDPEAKARAAAVETLALIAKERQQPCPLVVIEAMLDKDESVSQTASAFAEQFKSFAVGSVAVLLRCAGSENVHLRGNCLSTLGRAGGNDKTVVQAIEKAKHDKSFGIRHNAHVAMFHATGNLEEFLAYLIRLQEDPGVLGQVDTNSEAGKREAATRDVATLGAAMLIIEWSDHRADDLAPALFKLLASPSPMMRHGAARLVGASAAKRDLPDLSLTNPDLKKLLDPAQEADNPKKFPQQSKVAIQLVKLKVQDRLRHMRDNDPDHTVRISARIALERFANVQQKKRNGR